MTQGKTYFGETLRHAINQVQREIGPDAVIISTRRVENGFEVDAAPNHPTPPPEKADTTQNVLLKDMQGELARLRGMLENRLSDPSWNELDRDSQPTKTMVFSRLIQAGFSTILSQSLAQSLPDNLTFKDAWQQIYGLFAKRVKVCDQDLIDQKDVIAIVGPTGVGKTTTIAKMAAQFAMRYGPEQLGLITTDFYRVAGREQLRIYGRILGIPVHMVNNVTDLNHALDRLEDKRLILIDTAGISPRDDQLAQKFSMLTNQGHSLKTYLTVSATSHESVVQDAVSAFRSPQLSGAILTKVDECSRLGHALSIFIAENLPIAYLATGQKVPTDIQIATVEGLLARALSSNNLLTQTSTLTTRNVVDAHC